MEQKMMSLLRQDMEKTIKLINLENVSDIKGILEKQLNIIESLKEINITKEQLFLNTEEFSEEVTEKKESEYININSCSNIEINDSRSRYRFKRKLRGGFVPEINGFVPEGIVRSLGLEDGDILFAEKKDNSNPQSNHYKYELAEKGTTRNDHDRVQLNLCPVKKEAGHFVIDRSSETGDYIRYNEGLYTILLSDEDVINFKISEGDLIDVAYSVNNIETAKVIWKHPIEELTENVTKTMKNKKPQKDKGDTSFEKSLLDKSILVIGNEPKISDYKTCIEERGGTFLWGDSKDSQELLQAKVQKADIVIFLLALSGHIGMKYIKNLCKENNVIFKPIWNFGTTSIIKAAEGAQLESM